ncbi:MAG: hypothetical protein A3E61_01605 [Candidatus Colwellbacteria bacterium RIFCSPHIGHO2_12_FULL_43_12]|uniref:Uncharacterized protein n=1 Tax=Candidatus Colwellbacteria bacterium RIFCSPHIGHO2_12_FULL_43_12 TaxID=1797688 RepID=A0A1G1Z1J2_9BACT|nr:MAG: hypothetical protein A3E61_01605 [Candidatus Colwellbacteria bacterium RIFCSPHIGHO2_12_FULL_43_12]
MSEKHDSWLRWGILFLIIAVAVLAIYASYRLNHVVNPTLDNITLEVKVLSGEKSILSQTSDKLELVSPAEYQVTWLAPKGANCWYSVDDERTELYGGNSVLHIIVKDGEFEESYGLVCTSSSEDVISKHIDVKVYEPYNPETDRKKG